MDCEQEYWFLESDNDIEITNLRNRVGNITGAAISVTAFTDADGVALTGFTLPITGVEIGDGAYYVHLPVNANMVQDTWYTARVLIAWGGNTRVRYVKRLAVADLQSR